MLEEDESGARGELEKDTSNDRTLPAWAPVQGAHRMQVTRRPVRNMARKREEIRRGGAVARQQSPGRHATSRQQAGGWQAVDSHLQATLVLLLLDTARLHRAVNAMRANPFRATLLLCGEDLSLHAPHSLGLQVGPVLFAPDAVVQEHNVDSMLL